MTTLTLGCGTHNDETAKPAKHREAADAALFSVKIGNKYGFINNTGTVAIQPQFDGAKSFSEGYAAVCTGRCAWVETDETVKLRAQSVYEGNWGYINKQGQMVITPQFSEAGNFSQGLAAVGIGERKLFGPSPWHFGYIDGSGKVVIAAQFSFGKDFDDRGMAAVSVGWEDSTRWGFIDKTGHFRINPQFWSVEDFHDGLCEVRESKAYVETSYIDRTGKYVWRPEIR